MGIIFQHTISFTKLDWPKPNYLLELMAPSRRIMESCLALMEDSSAQSAAMRSTNKQLYLSECQRPDQTTSLIIPIYIIWLLLLLCFFEHSKKLSWFSLELLFVSFHVHLPQASERIRMQPPEDQSHLTHVPSKVPWALLLAEPSLLQPNLLDEDARWVLWKASYLEQRETYRPVLIWRPTS